jgi:hypothetical protein
LSVGINMWKTIFRGGSGPPLSSLLLVGAYDCERCRPCRRRCPSKTWLADRLLISRFLVTSSITARERVR